MKRNIAVVILLGMILTAFSGCSLGWEGEYISIEPYEDQNDSVEMNVVEVSNTAQMYAALVHLVESGAQSGVLTVADYGGGSLHFYLDQAISQAKAENPLCAYAVDEITYEIGTRGGVEAVALRIRYRYELSHILRIQRVDTMEGAMAAMEKAFLECEDKAVVRIQVYEHEDVAARLRDFALDHPDVIMEIPQIKAVTYPEDGTERIVEVRFTYKTERQELLRMQQDVEPVFTAAELYVRNAAQVREKYARMYAFLMERSEYEIKPSITPAYSLLNDGHGDHQAFARVFAAMCRRADLECYVVEGTRDGEPWTWNLIYFRGSYYHLDLLRCNEKGAFEPKNSWDMEGYSWNGEDYPD